MLTKNKSGKKNTKKISKKPSKQSKKLSFKKSNKKRILVFGAAFAVIGVATLALTSASTSNYFETEQSSLSASCVSVVSDSAASGSKAVKFGCTSTSPTSSADFTHPGVVYTKGDIDSWSTSSPEYSRLASTCGGTLNPSGSCVARSTPVVYGTTIDSGSNPKDTTNEINFGLKDQSGFAKVQAVLWAADNNNARRVKVISYLEQFRTVTGYGWDPVEQYRLNSGWGCTSLAQAAEIINYQDEQFKRFLREVCYPNLHWSIGANWHASFAESRLAIAAYLGDPVLWADAKAYFNKSIKQSIYHSAYDGNKINPIHSEDKAVAVKNSSGASIGSTVPSTLCTQNCTPHLSLTKSHWGGGTIQINDDYTLKTSLAPIVDGINAERMRDLGHVNMSYAAWVSGARTIRAQGEELEPHAYARLLKGWDYHATRVLAYIQTGTVPAPVPTQSIEGGAQFKQGFYSAEAFFGASTPQSILNALQRPEITSFPAGGTLHMVGEAFADGTTGPATKPKVGTAKSAVTVNASGEYILWVRMRAASATNNSVKVTIDSRSYNVGDDNIPTTGWTWVNYNSASKTNINKVPLSLGTHDVLIEGVEPDVLVDKVILLNTACVPLNGGENCTNMSPTVTISSPKNGEAFTSPTDIVIRAEAVDPDGTIAKVEFYEEGVKISEDTTSPYEHAYKKTQAGTYVLTARVYDNLGASSTSNLVSVVVNPAPPPPSPTPTPVPTTTIPAPTGLKLTSKKRDSLSFQWDKSTDSRADLYSVRWTKADSATVNDFSTWTYPQPSSNTYITINKLSSKTKYLIQVRARDSKDTATTSDDTLGAYTAILQAETASSRWYRFW